MAVIETIIPIFIIILFGFVIQKKGFLTTLFIQEANKFIFIISLPFLIFTGIVKANITDVALRPILCVILPTIMMIVLSLFLGFVTGLKKGRLGSFVQTTFHGNVSYIGLAVLFYLLGEEGFKRGSILIGFLILINNIMAIVTISWASQKHESTWKALLSIIKTPVIIATFLGLLVLYINLQIPQVLFKSMVIIANIALPMALIIIGASMSFSGLKSALRFSLLVSFLKLLVLPFFSLVLCRIFSISPKDGLPGVLLLATPTAVTSYVLAHELGGDKDLASSAVTLSTLLAPLTYIFWVSVIR